MRDTFSSPQPHRKQATRGLQTLRASGDRLADSLPKNGTIVEFRDAPIVFQQAYFADAGEDQLTAVR